MLNWFNNLKIAKKLYVGFCVVILVLVILSTIVFVNFSNYTKANDWNEHTYEVLSDLDNIVTSMINMETGQRGFSITGDEKFLEPYNKGKTDFEKYFNNVKELTSDNPKQQANLDKIKQLKEAWQQTAESSINLRREVVNKNKVMDDVIREELAAKGKTYMDNLRSIVTESTTMENALLKERDVNQNGLETSTKMVLIIGTLVAILCALFIAYYVSKIISGGIQKISNAANKLANGDMNINIETSTKDEIGELSNSFITMSESIRNLIKEILRLSENAIEGRLSVRGDVSAFKGDYRSIVDGVNKTLDAAVEPIKESTAVLNEISKANLQVAVEGAYKGDHAIIKDAINNTINAFNEVLGNINYASEQVAASARQVSASSQALSQGSTEQASSIEEITSSIEQVASQTRQNAVNANHANEFASAAKENAVHGNEQMSEMLKAMAEINDSSNNISKIIKVIDEIAFQTNILALNAAVEAARAGQHGKGFAVVAEEVRNLAARSANAAKETTAMIEGSIKKVDIGTKIANDTAAALNQIVEGVAKAADLVGEIAKASNEQASGIAQVNQGIMQVSQVVQTNSATSEESAAASEELSSQAQLLKEQVSMFKLKKSNHLNYKGIDDISPDVLKMLEQMNNAKSPDTHSNFKALRNIDLNEKEFGKY
ncbi:methyl-accepting chemotaxis protein [Pseudobacteroides cellulosolvens]|uniref:Methyl-accepting chemotaxis sensory transducer n=1 Tax=Pseudobacteroides cellulosolvens ATCC 35603 = DSM 2933 TaxID=398512 RepID=A0A0L6JMT5_9FIRM|nr:methyl-accepting chemotaxis protein [Pseudobacteroides cellulosolvens]KNY27078.1 methyl-accepting chemotaxis sensory transducer [Pseudobacteroides cellulosolvens ATCC 35603 = DSM 2933]